LETSRLDVDCSVELGRVSEGGVMALPNNAEFSGTRVGVSVGRALSVLRSAHNAMSVLRNAQCASARRVIC